MGFLSPSDATELLDYVSSTTLTRGRTLQRSGQVLQCIVHEDEDTVGTQVLRFGPMRALVLGLEAVFACGTRLDTLVPLRKDNRGIDLIRSQAD